MKESAIWWIRYRVRGEDLKVSSHTTDYECGGRSATRLKCRGQSRGSPGLGDAERVKVASLFDILIAEYTKSERATTRDATLRIESHLRPNFGHFRAAEFGTDDIERYQDRRTKQNAQNAAINRELALLRRAFHLASRRTPPLDSNGTILFNAPSRKSSRRFSIVGLLPHPSGFAPEKSTIAVRVGRFMSDVGEVNC